MRWAILWLCVFFASFLDAQEHDIFKVYNSLLNEGRLDGSNELGFRTSLRRQYPETVLIIGQFGSSGTGIFVEPRILVANFHSLILMAESWKKGGNIALQNPKTLQLVPVKKILALDIKHDLVLLEPEEGFSSQHFYSLDTLRDDYSPALVSVVGFLFLQFHVWRSGIAEDQDSAPFIRTINTFPYTAGEDIRGASGGPILFEDGTLAGILTHSIIDIYPPGILFAPAKAIKALMANQRLSCHLYTCIEEALQRFQFEAESQGDAATYFSMGFLKMFGVRFPKSTLTYLQWFKKAADLGHGHAQLLLEFIIDGMNSAQ